MSRRFDKDDVIPVLVMFVAVGIFLWIAYFLLIEDSAGAVKSQPVSEVVFDHSNCQYPNRLSNPANGCDNSDPARPECMKFGTEECEVGLEPDLQNQSAPEASHAVKILKCEE